jgi:UPF0716 protein FxsA
MHHPIKAIALGVLAWPAAEIVAFFCVAAAIGFGNALLLIVLMSLAGLLVLRRLGSGARRIQTAGGGFIAVSTWEGTGLAPGLGGILLLIPGFLTSVLGIAVLFPISRHWLLGSFGRMFATRRPSHGHADVIDLAPDEWRPLPGTKLPPADDPHRAPKRER